MKKLVTVTLVLLLAVGFLVVGNNRAEAMNNESAAVLAGTIAIFGLPVMHAIAQEIMYPGPGYASAYPAHYRPAYPSRYIERTKVIYVEPRYQIHRHRGWAYERGYHDGWCRHDDHKGRADARRDHRHYDRDDNDWR